MKLATFLAALKGHPSHNGENDPTKACNWRSDIPYLRGSGSVPDSAALPFWSEID